MPRLDRDLFGISHYICSPQVSSIAFLDDAAARGFSGVGLTKRALEEMPAPVLRSELKARRLRVTSINSAGYFLKAGSDADKQAARNQWILAYAAELGDAPVNVIVGGIGQGLGLDLDAARTRASEALAALHERAVTLGLRMIVEPMHPNSLWQRSCFNSLRQVEQAIAGLSNATINVDVFHSWWDPDLRPLLADDSRPLGVFQMCDVGAFTQDGFARRVPLGEGVVDIRGLIALCLRRKERPLLEVELFATQLPDRAMTDLLDQTVQYLNAIGR
ncbi:MAG: sugar phosphate isomerase/epimerase family protein [Variibacter sp.]